MGSSCSYSFWRYALSNNFCYSVFILISYKVFSNFLLTSLILWLFKRVFFNFYVWIFQFSSWLISGLIPLRSQKILWMISIFWNCLRHGLTCDLSCSMIHVPLSRMCILLFWGWMLCIYLSCIIGLKSPIFFLTFYQFFYLLFKVEYWSLLLLLCCCLFLPSFL